MWKNIFLHIGRFFVNHQKAFLIFLIIAITLIIAIIPFFLIYVNLNFGNFSNYRISRIDKRNKALKNRLEGKKPMRKLKLLNKFWKWRKKRVMNNLKILKLKIKNSDKLIAKYSWN